MEITIDLKNYDSKGTVFKRSAARGIISNGEHYLMIFSKYGDYKFPGGGIESDEVLEDALIREMKEETGYTIIKESIKSYGKVSEKRKGKYENILEMDSNYFLCQVESEVGERNLDEYEAEYDYQVVWITLNEAIEKNKQVIDLNICPWVIRDTKVMEYLLEESMELERIL